MKNKRISISILCFLIVSAIAVPFAIASYSNSKEKALENSRELAQSKKHIESSADKDDVLFLINNEPITKEKYQLFELGMMKSNANYSAEDILKEFIMQKAVIQEAIDRGITVTDDEAIADAKERYYTAKANNAADETIAWMEEMGMSEEEYFVAVLEVARKVLISQKFVEQIAQEEGLSTRKHGQEISEKFKDLRVELYYKCDVRLVDNSMEGIYSKLEIAK